MAPNGIGDLVRMPCDNFLHVSCTYPNPGVSASGKLLTGGFSVILQSSFSPNAGSIDGMAHVFVQDLVEKNDSWSKIFADVKSLQVSARQGKAIGPACMALENALGSIQEKGYFAVRFNLNERGFVRLAPTFCAGDPRRQPMALLLARQVYYYIKYAFHMHQHHNRSVDSLTTAHHTKYFDGAEQGAELGQALVAHLKKSLVAMKRTAEDRDYDHFIHTEGVIAYAKSLVVASHREGILGIEAKEDELSYLDNLNQSVQVRVNDFNANVQRAHNRSSFFNSGVLLLLALVAPFSLVYRDKIRERVTHFTGTDTDSPHLLVDLLARLLSSQWELITVLVIALLIVARLRLRPSRRLGDPLPLLRRYRTFLDWGVQSSRKGGVLWWTSLLMLAGLGVAAIFAALRMIFS